MKQYLNHLVMPINLSKTLLYSSEYRLLYNISDSLRFFVRPPHRVTNGKLMKHMRDGVIDLHRQDAENVKQGVYPFSVIRPREPLKHLRLLPKLIVDSVKISRRRKTLTTKDLVAQSDVPDYLKRNYHFQTDGYFSEESAEFYEHQVEILFSGTAAPMRRMLIKAIKDKMGPSYRPLRILEIGAGVGSATVDFAQSFNYERYVVSDVSDAYLARAKKRLNNPRLEFIRAQGEDLPFKDNYFDVVFSVFLFHELPSFAREEVLKETYRMLKPGGILGICDSLQKDDDPKLNTVLENFPKDYHEPFYRDYTLWDTTATLEDLNFQSISSSYHLLSKYYVARK